MFLTDSQTLSDLSIFTRERGVYEMYSKTATKGGQEVLKEIFDFPLSDAQAIQSRTALIQAFGELGTSFPFDKGLLEAAEGYLSERDERVSLAAGKQGLKERISNLVTGDGLENNIKNGVASLISVFQQLKAFIELPEVMACGAFSQKREQCADLLKDPFIAGSLEHQPDLLKVERLPELDRELRFKGYQTVRRVLRFIYEIDVYFSMNDLARGRDLHFAEVAGQGPEPAFLSISQLRHPLLEGAKGNDIEMTSGENLIFLTGANMAGKSTLMKSIGIAVYLAHLGLPVPARKMRFSVMDGLLTTINLPDNLGMGASHFYAEVLRVKKIALELKAGKRLVVLFDELFRGTNVKDAAEATTAVLEGFTQIRSSFFIVSTHIMEAADMLGRHSQGVQYLYMPTMMEDNRPVYTYQLQKGVTEDRHGMVIIRKEGILQMLEQGAPR